MEPTESRATILAVLASVAPEIDPGTIDGSAELRFDLDLDSMDFLNLVEGVAAATGLEIPERDYPRLETLDAFGAYLAERVTPPHP